jgi:hypothetical protein
VNCRYGLVRATKENLDCSRFTEEVFIPLEAIGDVEIIAVRLTHTSIYSHRLIQTHPELIPGIPCDPLGNSMWLAMTDSRDEECNEQYHVEKPHQRDLTPTGPAGERGAWGLSATSAQSL